MRSALAWYQGPAAASVPSLKVKQWTAVPLKMGPIGYPEMSVTINLRCVASQNSENFISRLPTTLFTKFWWQHKFHLTASRRRPYSKIWHTWVAYGKQYFIRLASWWPIKSKLTTLELIQQVLFTDKSCKLNRGKCKFGASGTYAQYLVWHCFWSGAVYRIYTYSIPVRACLEAETLRGNLSSGSVEVRSFSSLCNEG